jgi:hypothetical protein
VGLFDKQSQRADELIGQTLDPLLIDGEQVLGRLLATHSKAFSATVYAIAVTPQRLIFQPVGRKLEAKGEPVSVTPSDIVKSSVDGFGAGLAEFLRTNPGEIRITTNDHTFKLSALGGGIDQMVTGDAQRDGKQALLEFLYSARNSAP